ncbi:poly(A)-specific ribonuclease PNLDC1-like [Latimeria chalumnae]|uniref:poly(A)-specific ribonuclease PNLDC1-like n=1 Tax=Latimeria chalumnae TaxID=7897 RepID=UPI00313F0D85
MVVNFGRYRSGLDSNPGNGGEQVSESRKIARQVISRVFVSRTPSLFDSAETRYQKLRLSVQKFTVSQIGLSIFSQEGDRSNGFTARSYNFSLFPPNFGKQDTEFSVQSSSAIFLARFGFDFNQFMKEGIPYLNEQQEAELRRELASGICTIHNTVIRDQLRSIIDDVTQWLASAKEGNSLTLPQVKGLQAYEVQLILRQALPNIWTEVKGQDEVVVYKVSLRRRKNLEQMPVDPCRVEAVLQAVLGFTNLFRVLVIAKKPVVGHNMFLDLLYLHEKFYRPLPERYEDFKQNLHSLFPCIIDTKSITRVLRKEFGLARCFSLLQLCQTLRGALENLKLPGPIIKHATECWKYGEEWCLFNMLLLNFFFFPPNLFLAERESPHEAGYDAYLCGSALLQMAHLLLCHKDDLDCLRTDFSHYMEAVKPYQNQVNLIRASVSNMVSVRILQLQCECRRRTAQTVLFFFFFFFFFILIVSSSSSFSNTDFIFSFFQSLTGADPVSQSPPLLLVSVRGWLLVDESQIYNEFRALSSVDVRRLDSSHFLLAANNFKGMRWILKTYRNNPSLLVSVYRYWRHDPNVNCTLWVCAVTAAWAILAFFLGGSFRHMEGLGSQ